MYEILCREECTSVYKLSMYRVEKESCRNCLYSYYLLQLLNILEFQFTVEVPSDCIQPKHELAVYSMFFNGQLTVLSLSRSSFRLFLKRVNLFAGFYRFGHAALESCQNDDRCGTFVCFSAQVQVGGWSRGEETSRGGTVLCPLSLLLLLPCRVPLSIVK